MATEKIRTRSPLWMRALLLISLAMNLAIVGLVAGFLLRDSGPIRGGGPGASFGLPYLIALERDDRRAVMDRVRGDDALPNRRMRRAHFEQMITLIRAEPLDRAAVEELLTRQTRTAAAVQLAAQAEWVAQLESMGQEARMAYADRIETVLKRGPKGNRKPQPQND
ncbi:MAG: periplasmic heavy metal sensor [Pseudomonadota bacterium]